MCTKCGDFYNPGGELVHLRWCTSARADIPGEATKRVRLTRMFMKDVGAELPPQLGGGGPRREDVCVQIAADETVGMTGPTATGDGIATDAPCVPMETPPPSPNDDSSSEDGEAEWSGDISTEEITEAMRRMLLRVGVACGAKTCEQLIRLLHHPSYSQEAIQLGVPSYRGLLADADEQLDQTLTSLRFTRGMVEDDGEDVAEAPFWKRDAVDVVRRQIAKLTLDVQESSRLYVKPLEQLGDDGKRVISHPLSTRRAASVMSNVRKAAMTACAEGVEGVDGWCDGYDFVLLLQIYSDKSSQTLKTNSHTHFPLHVAVMNTSIEMKEKLIARGDTIVGYLPTNITWESEETKMYTTELEDSVGGRGSRASRLRIVHNAMKESLHSLLSKDIAGFEVRDSTGRVLRCHPVLWSYVTDLPEGWDMSSSVSHRCSRCFTLKSELGSTNPSARKSARTIIPYYDKYERMAPGKAKTQWRKEMWDKYSLSTTRPYLLSLGENYGVDMFKCLRFESMHNIHLGLTRTLLECMSERLKSKQLRSPEFIVKKTGQMKMFKTIRTTVLRALNVSLELMDRQSPWIDFKVCFTSQKKTTALNGLFQDKGLASMLEARDYSRVLQVMPFLGATVDRMCGEKGTTTRICVQYVELVYKMTRVRARAATFTSEELRDLRADVKRFMEQARDLYGDHQSSEMGTPKMHTLMHVVDDIEEGGALQHNRAEIYEMGHRVIKGPFETQSKRGEKGHEEALNVIGRNDFLRFADGKTDRGARISVVKELSDPKPRVYGARTKAKMEAAELDTVATAKPQVVAPASDILKFVSDFDRLGRMADTRSLSRPIRDLITDLGGGVPGYWAVPDFVWFMKKLKLGPSDTVQRSSTTQVSGHPFPVCERWKDGKKMLISVDDGACGVGTVKRELQKVVASHSYYGSKHPFQSMVMIEAHGPEDTKNSLHHSVRGKYAGATVRAVWIAKVLALLRVTRREAEEVGSIPRRPEVSEHVLVQYMSVCKGPLDDVDKALGCTKLKWAEEIDDDDIAKKNLDRTRRHFDVQPVETIRGLVHVVRGDYGLGKSKTYECQGDRHWAKKWFYLNRFKLDRRGASHIMKEREKTPEAPA